MIWAPIGNPDGVKPMSATKREAPIPVQLKCLATRGINPLQGLHSFVETPGGAAGPKDSSYVLARRSRADTIETIFFSRVLNGKHKQHFRSQERGSHRGDR